MKHKKKHKQGWKIFKLSDNCYFNTPFFLETLCNSPIFQVLQNSSLSLSQIKNWVVFKKQGVHWLFHAMCHSTPVVKYLAVIIAYLFKWWGNIKYHKFSAETGQ